MAVMRLRILSAVSVGFFLVASMLAGAPAMSMEDASNGVDAPTGVANEDAFGEDAIENSDEDEVAKWTVLLYIVADNDLDVCFDEDFQELKDGGSSDSVNVLIFADRLEEGAYYYTIEDNEAETLKSLGEVNMGDPEKLTDFVEYANQNYKAKNRILFFWDHGTPTGGVGADWTMPGDERPGESWDWLTHHEVMEALEGEHMDVIATDECSIGQMETLYEYVAGGLDVDYMVASESYIGYRGFTYDKIMQRLVADPDMDALELCEVIVDEFTNLFTQAPYMAETLTTQSIFDMSKIAALADAVSTMADTLADDIDSYRQIIGSAQRGSIIPWGARGESWIDMPNFVETIQESVDESDPAYAACKAVIDAYYGEAMLGMGVAKNTEIYGYNGIGITFPASHSSYSVAYAESDWGGFNIYITFEFPNMGWWDFLQTYWGFE
ncbi:MAG: hypothetical protein JSV94_04655 [Methanobacteriota archaeon]|nr:MAG: hypothetical protein JSV94_04655 [Euryarchaeota archaeon]